MKQARVEYEGLATATRMLPGYWLASAELIVNILDTILK